MFSVLFFELLAKTDFWTPYNPKILTTILASTPYTLHTLLLLGLWLGLKLGVRVRVVVMERVTARVVHGSTVLIIFPEAWMYTWGTFEAQFCT